MVGAVALFTWISSPRARAETIVTTGDVVDETWTPAGSPYLVHGTIRVPPGRFLHIEAGTVVRVANVSGQDPTGAKISVEGSLRVHGTVANPVRIDALYNVWRGIVIEQGAQAAIIEGAIVEDGFNAVRTFAEGQVLVIRDSVFRNNRSIAVVISAGRPSLTRVAATGNEFGIWAGVSTGPMLWDRVEASGNEYDGLVISSATVTVTNALVHDNGRTGIFVAPLGTVAIQHATVHANGEYGIDAEVVSSTLHVMDSVVTGHEVGVRNGGTIGSGSFTVTDSDVFGNDDDYDGVVPGVGTISRDPRYVSATDLRLRPDSPCIDAAGPGDAIDHDLAGGFRPVDGDLVGGAASDMGAFELVPGCGDGFVHDGEECDDDNLDGGDGCSATCTLEVGTTPDAGVAVEIDASVPAPDAMTSPPDAGVEPVIDASPATPDAMPGVPDAAPSTTDAMPGTPDADTGAMSPDANAMSPDAAPTGPGPGEIDPIDQGCSCRIGRAERHGTPVGVLAGGAMLLAALAFVRRRRR